MPRPFYSTKTFSGNQEVTWEVTVYETPNTIASKGIIYRPATPASTFGSGIDFNTATLAEMNTHFDNNTTPGLKDSAGTEVNGRIPIIYDYWGSQAPLGVYTSGQVVLRFKGYIKTTGDYGIGAFGKGNVKIFREGNVITLNGLNYSATDESNPAVTTTLTTYTAGDEVNIFYWGVNLDWGGIGVRVWTNSSVSDSDGIDWELMRDQDLLTSSWMDDNVTVDSTTLPEALNVSVTHAEGQISTCNIPIVIGGDNDTDGWQYDHVNKTLSRIGSTETLKIGYLVKATGGYTGEEHPSFTGHIVDIQPQKNTAVLLCESLDGRLTNQLSENLPDKLSYAANGYAERTGVENPAFGVPAYDHWPYELAVRDMLARAWIDASLINGKKEMRRVGQSSSEDGEGLFRVRSLGGAHIRIQRQANYGNPYGDTSLPEDDPYLTTSELTQSLYDRVTSITDRIGYLFRTDYEGNIVITPRNNPSSMTMIDSGGVEVIHPAAISGTYRKFTGAAWSKVISNVKASRIDLVVVRSPGFGEINVAVTRSEDSWTDSINLDLDYADETLYYDQVLTVDLTNITSLAVVEGEDYATYTLTITPVGAGGGTEFGLNAIRVFETDPMEPISEFNLSSLENMISIKGKSNYRDHVNDAIVTGARRAVLTDSAKVFEDIATEYVVSRSTDIHSILNPNVTNYDGRKITSFLSNESIADKDLADWTSRALVSQYRLPEPSLSGTHTTIPSLELGDPVYITEAQFEQFDNTKRYWVTSFTTTYKPGNTTQTIEFTPFSNVPSYEPREEIDISLFNNNPIINLSISYPSLSGSGTITNPIGDGVVSPSVMEEDTNTITNIGGWKMTVGAGTMSPDTGLLHVPVLGGAFSVKLQEGAYHSPELHYFKNNPYHQFYSKSGTELSLPFTSGDGTSTYDITTYHIAAGNSATFYWHKIQDAYSGTSPFYDPYYSELSVAELIDISFDALISGYYRVSVVDARKEADPITVAWLTEPSADDTDEHSHWTYLTAGPTKNYLWDGVDNIGNWNKVQSEEYSWRQKGSFPTAETPLIGRGFYAQNDNTTGMTHFSDEIESSEVCYPIGNYSKFFIRVEVIRDTSNNRLIVESKNDDVAAADTTLRDSTNTPLADRFIYYHLPQPNTVTVDIEDWVVTGGYNPDSPGSSWNASPDPDATFRDDKPVKIGITAQERKGAKFPSNALTGVKVHRVAHLSGHIWDQTATMSQEAWNDRNASSTKKRIVSRRFNVDDHTLIFKDASFTRGDQVTDWTFYPSLFEKDFGRGEQSIEYTNYNQLTEVPSWNPGRDVGEDRSRHLLALMGYLFYLSVFTQDRSGRLAWAVDTGFVDKSKILTNTDTTKFPSDLNRHQRRTVYTRQWWDYDLLYSNLNGNWGISQKYFGGFADVFDYHTYNTSMQLFPLQNTTTYYSNSLENANLDPYTNSLYAIDRLVLDGVSGTGPFYRDFGTVSGGVPNSTTLGTWTWESDGFVWIPSISRDFHPFYAVPPMGGTSYMGTEDGEIAPWWWYNFRYAVAGKDEAAYDNYFARIYDRTSSDYTTYRLSPGRVVEERMKDETIPDNIIQFQKQDDVKHFEECRGSFTNGPGQIDTIMVPGGDPYYCNAKIYRYFQGFPVPSRALRISFWNDVWRKGWWHMSFRHTYNWESASFFPVDESKCLVTGAIDSDRTQSPLIGFGYDAGAYTGWKDDHPSTQQEGSWRETGTADEIYWRNLNTNHGYLKSQGSSSSAGSNPAFEEAGGTSEIEDPDVTLSGERKTFNGNTHPNNIFMQRVKKNVVTDAKKKSLQVTTGMMPIAVGPRLPETRRILMALTLMNNRRTSPL